MPIEWSEESAYKKELNRWNRPKNEFIVKPDGTREYGMNRVGFEKFPQMLYKAQRNPMSDKYEVCLDRDVISLDKTVVLLSAEQFNATCQLIVNDQRELERALDEGWRESRKEAMAYQESLQQDIARAAAERAYRDRNMSEKAQAEAKKAEEATAAHLPEIPEQPKRGGWPKGRKRKQESVPA